VVQLAEVLAFESGKRVLVIDANFNADVSLSLIGDFRFERLESEGATLTRLYRDYSEGSDYFDLNASIQRRVSNLYIATLDLIVSGIGLEKMIEQCTSEQIHGSLVSIDTEN
jgi:chromosome partitioning protein